MAASSFNNSVRVRDENTHAYQHLNMGFVLELQKSVEEFNQSLVEFDLVSQKSMHALNKWYEF